jgi:hypothetical protein
MEVRKIVHIFNECEEIYNREGWEIRCHSRAKIVQRIETRDNQESTEHLLSYNKLREEYKEEFYKYVTLHYEGGLFARYENDDEIPVKDLSELVNYCNNRQISLFQCPSAIIVGFVHHPQLMGMLSDENFHPLSHLYKKTQNSIGHKTLVTSLPLNSYLEKIRVSQEPNVVTIEEVKKVSAIDGAMLGVITATVAAITMVLSNIYRRTN